MEYLQESKMVAAWVQIAVSRKVIRKCRSVNWLGFEHDYVGLHQSQRNDKRAARNVISPFMSTVLGSKPQQMERKLPKLNKSSIILSN